MSSGPEYEKMVAELVSGLQKGTSLDAYALGSGSKNKLIGASGYAHQIDLSVKGANELYIFELKCLKKSIGVEEILVFAGRLHDISMAMPLYKFHASIISLKKSSRNVPNLAAHFGINVEVVESLYNFGISFSHQHFVGLRSSVQATSSMDAEIIRASLVSK